MAQGGLAFGFSGHARALRFGSRAAVHGTAAGPRPLLAGPCSDADVVEMTEFFEGVDEYTPLFRRILSAPASSSEAPARSVFSGAVPDAALAAWDDPLPALPTSEQEVERISSFLDYLQKSLQEMPVDESNVDMDSLDMDFIEKGRRLMVVGRFQVVEGASDKGAFKTCWAEVAELTRADEADTGSLILFPGYGGQSMLEFSQEQISRILGWLGVEDMEVWPYCSQKSDAPMCGIMLIKKLSDIPVPTEDSGRVYTAADFVDLPEDSPED